MRAVATAIPVQVPLRFQSAERLDITLLELVNAICDVTDDDREVIATVLHMLNSGRVRLCGNFRGCSGRDLS